MESQADGKVHEFDQEVDAIVGKNKRKLSETQLKALAEGPFNLQDHWQKAILAL